MHACICTFALTRARTHTNTHTHAHAHTHGYRVLDGGETDNARRLLHLLVKVLAVGLHASAHVLRRACHCACMCVCVCVCVCVTERGGEKQEMGEDSVCACAHESESARARISACRANVARVTDYLAKVYMLLYMCQGGHGYYLCIVYTHHAHTHT